MVVRRVSATIFSLSSAPLDNWSRFMYLIHIPSRLTRLTPPWQYEREGRDPDLRSVNVPYVLCGSIRSCPFPFVSCYVHTTTIFLGRPMLSKLL